MTPKLKGWSPLTSRLLIEGGSSAWNVIDEAVGEDVCSGIEKELEKAQVVDKLLPARTTGEAEVDKLLTLFKVQEDSPATLIRGDKSLYLSREYRRDARFPQRHQNLHQLIETVQTTLVESLSPTIQLDTSQTSVQLAVYPGDGQSGYIRHCDRGQGVCQEEGGHLVHQQIGRIISAVYYLTNADWNATDDGGHLRLFHSDSQTTDVVPYRDRLVLFRADGVEHQVLPSKRRPRTAITMWFYGTMLPSIPTTIPNQPVDSQPDNQSRSSPVKTKQSPANDDSLTVSKPNDPPPLPISVPGNNNTHSADMSIFVAIASYRDSETIATLTSLMSQAQYPRRIFVGLVLQIDGKQDSKLLSEINSIIEQNSSQIRCLRMDCKDASGPCYARAFCQSLHRGENYFLQIDSHMRLRRNWDSYLIELHQQITRQRHDARVILTTYPVGYTLPNKIPNETRATLLVPWKFDDSGLLRQRGRLLQPRCDPVPCHLIAAGFLFGPGQVVQKVPYDPSLHQLFFGEELSLAVRLFTHGYDCYAPPETVCYHLWSRAYRPIHRVSSPLQLQQRATSLETVRNQLLGNCQASYYGLGSTRSVHDFWKALHVDFASQRFLHDAFENGNLPPTDFVPEQSLVLYPEKSLEHEVAALDLTTRLLISEFLNHL